MKPIRYISFLLLIISNFSIGAGLLLSFALKTQKFTDWVLPKWPPYLLAMDAIRALQDFKYSVNIQSENLESGLINIDEPYWKVIFDFVRSDIALKKSGRGDVEYIQLPQQTPESGTAQDPESPIKAPPIEFERIKSIISIKIPARMAVGGVGGKALTPPYMLSVFWPSNIARFVYEFVSFEEFRLDLRRMIIDQLETYTTWLSLGGFISTLLLSALRWWISRSGAKSLSVNP